MGAAAPRTPGAIFSAGLLVDLSIAAMLALIARAFYEFVLR